MVGTRCRIGFIQYMPKKPVKFGIKLWVLCDASTGYCLQFQIYTGKVENSPEKGLARRVVFDLLQRYLDKNYHVYYDNFYSTTKLFQDLEERDTYACGTVRKDRGSFPKEFQENIPSGSMKFVRDGNLVAVHWRDKRDVYCMSTIHGTNQKDVTRRGKENPVKKPEMIIEYNKFMNGVDKCDQYLSSYPFNRRTMKWWKKVFVRLVDLAVINAMVIYFEQNPDLKSKYQSHKKFRIALIHALVQSCVENREPVSKHDDPATRLQGKHFPTSKYPEAKKCCTVCGYKKNKNGKQARKKTWNYCEKCNKFICKLCFETYHTKLNLQ